MNASALRRRLAWMLAISVACFVAAAAAIVGWLAADIAILGPVFVAAIAAGVAAQVWFIVGVAKAPAGKA